MQLPVWDHDTPPFAQNFLADARVSVDIAHAGRAGIEAQHFAEHGVEKRTVVGEVLHCGFDFSIRVRKDFGADSCVQFAIREDVAEGPKIEFVSIPIDSIQSVLAPLRKAMDNVRDTYTKKIIMIAAAISSSFKPAALDSVSRDFVNQAASGRCSNGSL